MAYLLDPLFYIIIYRLDINTNQQLLENVYNLRTVFTDSSFDFFVKSALGIARAYHELKED